MKPNLLLIMTDQQRWDALGCAGGVVRTPNMDRLAAEGVRFTTCLTNAPVCIPARRSLATGLYPHNTGVWDNMQTTLDPETPTWMRAVRDAGYRTSVFGKTHLHPHGGDLRDREHLVNAYGLDDVDEIGGPRASARCGSYMTDSWAEAGLWDAYREDFAERFEKKPHMVRPSPLGVEHYYDTYVGRRARDYLETYDRDVPWFCWVSFGGPHEPWDAPEPYASMYDPAEMPAPIEGDLSGGDRPEGRLDGMLRERPVLTPEEISAMRANYAGNVSLIDDQLGGIFETIEARGEWDRTVAVLVSDHGEMNGDFGLLYKSQLMNSAARVPLLIRAPGSAAGSTCASPVEWFDVGPTMAQLAGAELNHRQFARSLVPCLQDPTHRVRPDALSEMSGEVALLDERWKLVVNAAGHPYLLFDLENDPHETRNLAGLPDTSEMETELRLRVLERLIQAQLG